MANEKPGVTAKPKVSRVEVYWTTVTYKTVAIYFFLIVTIALAVTYLLFTETFNSVVRRVTETLSSSTAGVATVNARQARFVNLDGKVQVKKVNSVQWTTADYQVTLDKGDLIQTGPDGVARITFADGTTYTVKADTLVTVEENLVAQDRASKVGVHISSGAVDLATGAWEVPGSKAEVSFENAVASLRENSHAIVRSDPASQQHEITVASGGAELERGGQTVQVGQWEKISFPTGGPVTRSQVLAPPPLTSPVNLQPIFVDDPKKASVHFEWQAAPNAKSYQLQVSATAMFTQVEAERHTGATSADVAGLDPGEYFWRVRAVDAKSTVSEASDPYKFTLVAQGKGQEMLLEVEGTELHGSVAEVIGRTEPGAALMINGQQVANIAADGKFSYFIEGLAHGSQTIVITGQNRRGGTAIKRVPIVIP